MSTSYSIGYPNRLGPTYVELVIENVKRLFKAGEVIASDGKDFAFESPLNATDALAALNSMDWRLPISLMSGRKL